MSFAVFKIVIQINNQCKDALLIRIDFQQVINMRQKFGTRFVLGQFDNPSNCYALHNTVHIQSGIHTPSESLPNGFTLCN